MSDQANNSQAASDTVNGLVGEFFGPAEHPAPFIAAKSKTVCNWLVLDAHRDAICVTDGEQSAHVIALALNRLCANKTGTGPGLVASPGYGGTNGSIPHA